MTQDASETYLVDPERLRVGRGGRVRWEVSEAGCWLWLYGKGRHGYGLASLGTNKAGTKRSQQAHRWVYEQLVGPIPEGLTLDHSCSVHACVNPSHLEPVTQLENVRRGRRPRFTEDDVREIRRLASAGMYQYVIAERFGTSQGNIANIVRRHTWKDVA